MKNNVREERIKLDITQQELADAISVSRQTIFAIETGKYTPSVILALKLSQCLKRKVEDLFVLEKED
ncbi:transcriptional regulator [Chitinophagaceae bacterium IBVUCB1]|nr:transcriptional regulator [Chitinophagaceae bacterium IBVUCB1]